MATKEAYQKRLQAQFSEWDARLAELRAKARKASAEARIRYEDELESLERRRAAVQKSLDEFAARGEGAWEDMKSGLEKAWDEMGKAIDQVAKRFK